MLPKANRAMTVLIYVMKAAKVTLERNCQEDQDWEGQWWDLLVSSLGRQSVKRMIVYREFLRQCTYPDCAVMRGR